MTTLALILVAIIGLLHVLFGIAEMFFWPRMAARLMGLRDPNDLKLTSVLAFNQGLYNLLVAAGLFWAVVFHSETTAIAFLIFVIIAGIVGAATASTRILYIQAVPAVIALLAVLV